MKTVTISRRTLVFSALAVVAVVGVILVIVDIERSAAGNGEAEAAAAHALGQMLDLDYEEGREGWEARVRPLCTGRGWTFWGGPFFADQVWPMVVERQYTTESVEVVEARGLGDGPEPDSQVVEVSLEVTYTLGGERREDSALNRVVMVRQDGRWLLDRPVEREQ